MRITISPSVEGILNEAGITPDIIRGLADEYINRMGLKSSDLAEISCLPGNPDVVSTYGRAHLQCGKIEINCPPGRTRAVDFRATLIHELAHIKRHLQGGVFQMPSVGNAGGGWEYLVLYYATSPSELEALAWEASVSSESKCLLKEAVRYRLRLKDLDIEGR